MDLYRKYTNAKNVRAKYKTINMVDFKSICFPASSVTVKRNLASLTFNKNNEAKMIQFTIYFPIAILLTFTRNNLRLQYCLLHTHKHADDYPRHIYMFLIPPQHPTKLTLLYCKSHYLQLPVLSHNSLLT